MCEIKENLASVFLEQYRGCSAALPLQSEVIQEPLPAQLPRLVAVVAVSFLRY